MILLTFGLIASLTGCKSKDETTVNDENKSAEAVTDKITDDKTETEEPDEANTLGAVLGGDPKDFTGFEYLYAESLRTESEENSETGQMESKEITVMIPKDEYKHVDRTYASVDSLGVNFKVSLNPYLQYEQDDYLIYENLQMYLDNEFDEFYSTEYKDLDVSEVEQLGNNRAYANVSYIYYDDWNDMYVPIYKTYYLIELEKNLTVMVELEINLAETTGKTQMLLDEIESFYEFESGWVKADMEEKVANYIANDNGTTDSFSTGYMIFELPKGWDEDYDFNDNYSAYTYAPDGDGTTAECAISIEREYVYGEEYDVESLLTDKDAAIAMFTEEMGEGVSNVNIVDMGETILGHTVKLYMDVEQDGILAHYAFYFASNKDYMYTIYAIHTDNAAQNSFEVAENVIATAQVKEY